jgi:hypothetical protein
MNADTTTCNKEDRESWIAFWVAEFLEDSNAMRTLEDPRDVAGVHWRIEMIARRAFLNEVWRLRDSGYLLYLHDGCSLVKKDA